MQRLLCIKFPRTEFLIIVDDTSLFSKIENKHLYTVQMNKDLKVISNSAYQWKMLFNPNP